MQQAHAPTKLTLSWPQQKNLHFWEQKLTSVSYLISSVHKIHKNQNAQIWVREYVHVLLFSLFL